MMLYPSWYCSCCSRVCTTRANKHFKKILSKIRQNKFILLTQFIQYRNVTDAWQISESNINPTVYPRRQDLTRGQLHNPKSRSLVPSSPLPTNGLHTVTHWKSAMTGNVSRITAPNIIYPVLSLFSIYIIYVCNWKSTAYQ